MDGRISNAEREVERLTQVLDDIAHSWSNDADFLRNMAARAIFEKNDGCDLNDTLDDLRELAESDARINKSAVDTATAILKGLDTKYLLPNVHPGAKGNVAFTWEKSEGITITLLVGTHMIELFTTHNQHSSVHMSPRSYTSGDLPPDMLRYIPLKDCHC